MIHFLNYGGYVMPIIYDNIEKHLKEGLYNHISDASHVDYCVGYFNLRGWNIISNQIDNLSGCNLIEKGQSVFRYCRLLVGMNKTPKESLIESFISSDELIIDNQKAARFKKRLAEEFKEQLTIGTPSKQDEETLKALLRQLKDGRVVVKLYLKHLLHAKLYLSYQNNINTPVLGLLGSSNLTFSGLAGQGELNVDVLEQDAAVKLSKWFNDRWNDRWCIDITNELIGVLESSWAREDPIPPYYIYLKIAYHLSKEARTGINEFRVPSILNKELLDFQQKAVLIAANHLNKRNGVIVGDVVGLGKTITATAIAKIFEEDLYYETLILCPKNLVDMWDYYVYKYQLHAKIIAHSMVINKLPDLRRYRLVIIDESHNLRNREGRRYQAIREYLEKNDCKVILLSATPYNKSFLDLSNQLRLFLSDDADLGISPEKYINEIGGMVQFNFRHPDIHYRSIRAFEKSEYADDWRELMKYYMIRRTRSFIRDNYAITDEVTGRKYLTFSDGSKSYFPDRIPKKVEFKMSTLDKHDQYAMLYSESIISTIDELELPRYGLGNYLDKKTVSGATENEKEIMKNLSRAGKQLMGFCRTNLFKRLESSGYSFLLSLSRHILRNFIFIYALERDLPLPIGKQYMNFFDEYLHESDDEGGSESLKEFYFDEGQYFEIAEKYYNIYSKEISSRFGWISSKYFKPSLKQDLINDSKKILSIFGKVTYWDGNEDRKLNALNTLLTETHGKDKVIVFTQFADTAKYIEEQMKKRGVDKLVAVTGDSENVTALVQRFSPESNDNLNIIGTSSGLRIIITTDVLSEGQNLQDSHIVVNYDLPWAIIRLIQRAGRVDRLGQKSDKIYCYSFLPEDGIEHIIKLRSRLKNRIKENAEVVGSDEVFFDGDPVNLADIYSEKAGILDENDDDEVDLASFAYQIWKNAIDNNSKLKKIIPELPNVVFSAKENSFNKLKQGSIVYAKTANENDILTWINKESDIITQSQFAILKAIQCSPDTPWIEKLSNHHELVKKGIDIIMNEEKQSEGTLGRKSSIKYRTYMQLERFYNEYKDTLLVNENLKKAMDDIYRYPLKGTATDTLSRQLKIGIPDEKLAELVVSLREENKLCVVGDNENIIKLPQVICSMGLVNKREV